MNRGSVSVSIVSHGQGDLVQTLLADLNAHCASNVCELLLTDNLNEGLSSLVRRSSIPARVVLNAQPKGFGANHNAASRLARGDYFCVVNPDIRLQSNPFAQLTGCMDADEVALAAPHVVDECGVVEDNARFVPTPLTILKKALGVAKRLDYPISDAPFFPDWVAGMFMLFRRETFAAVGGFDEQRYHLYYEDVDICARLWLAGRKIILCPSAVVMHAARRESHRNLVYLGWHLASMFRFFTSPIYLKFRRMCLERSARRFDR